MKFHSKISFLSYIISPDNFGGLIVTRDNSLGSYGKVSISFENKDKQMPDFIFNKIYDIVSSSLFHESFNDYYSNIDSQFYHFINNNNSVILSEGSYSTRHSYEMEEIQSELKSILDNILFKGYYISISVFGKYAKFDQDFEVLIERFNLYKHDDDGNEIHFNDNEDRYKNLLVKKISKWVLKFSAKSSKDEYAFDSYSIKINDSGKFDDFDSLYEFIEISNYPLHDESNFNYQFGEQDEVFFIEI